MENSAFCKGLYKNFGACVDIEELKTIVGKGQKDIDTNTDVETSTTDVLTTLEAGVGETTAEGKKIKELKDKIKNGIGKCREGMKKVNNGLICLLTSAKASDFA
jgi:hypothetical protein